MDFRRLDDRRRKINAAPILDSLVPQSGDAYFMPLSVNDVAEHCIRAASSSNASASDTTDDVRISLVFFVETPDYAIDFVLAKKKKSGFLG